MSDAGLVKFSEVSIRHTFTLRRPSSGQDTGEIENEEGEYYKTGRPNTHTSTDSSAVLLLNNSSHHEATQSPSQHCLFAVLFDAGTPTQRTNTNKLAPDVHET